MCAQRRKARRWVDVERAGYMNSNDDITQAEQSRDRHDRSGVLEDTDIESDEDRDGDVDADSAAAIGERNDAMYAWT